MMLGADSLKLDQVRRNFSRHVDEYDRYALVQKSVARNLLQLLPSTVEQGKALEVGCGTGIFSRMFLNLCPGSKLVLSDLAHGMSCHAAAQFSDQLVVDADAAALPFASSSFDLVLSSSVYQWVDQFPQAFAELQRVLRPDGRVGMALFGEKTLYELRQSHAEASPLGKSHNQGFPDCAQVEAALDGRFEIELLKSRQEIEWHPGVPDLLRSLKAIGAQNASRNRPDGLASRQLMQHMYECYVRSFGRNGMIPATYEVIYLLLRKG